MSETYLLSREWEGHQTQPNLKHKEFYATQTKQKAIEWLQTQTHEKKWDGHEKRGESRQRAKNGEEIVVINGLYNSEHDILTMVEQVLTKNEFSDDSSIFVVVPSIDFDPGNSSDHPNSSVCMQMIKNPVPWKTKDKLLELDTTQHRNSINHQGMKLSSKGKTYFWEGLPANMLSNDNTDALFDHRTSLSKDDRGKAMKNKLCQITTPSEIVQRVENQFNVVGMDTTVDRPCCCTIKTDQCSENDSNNKQRRVAKVVSNLITPLHDKPGIIGTPMYTGLDKNLRESVRSVNVPIAPNKIPQWRPQHTQYHNAGSSQQFAEAPIQQLTCSSTQPNARPFLQHHTKASIHQLTCAPTNHLTWAPNQERAEACPPQQHAELCPTQYRDEDYPNQGSVKFCFPDQRTVEACPPYQRPTEANIAEHPVETCPTEHRAEACPLCQCTPDKLLELFKLAVTGGKLHGFDIECGLCPELPETEPPPAEPKPGDRCIEPSITNKSCPCNIHMQSKIMQIEMGETKQKRGKIRQTRFSSTVGTSTDRKLSRRIRAWWSCKKNVCECTKAVDEANQDPEPTLTLESYFAREKRKILSPEVLKKNSLETERVSGFRLIQEKKVPPEPEGDFTIEDAIRYIALMHPDLFQSVVEEHQAKLDGTYRPPPPPTPSEVETPSPLPETKGDEGFKGLKFKLGGKGSASQGLAGVCCFDLLTESFTTW